MKKKSSTIIIFLNCLTSAIQATVLAFIPKNEGNIKLHILYYGLCSILFVIIINFIPHFVNHIMTIDYKDGITPQTYYASFLPLVISIKKRSVELDKINRLQLLHDWRMAVTKLFMYLESLTIVHDSRFSYDENKLYSEEILCAINELTGVYEQCKGFEEIITMYKCENMSDEIIGLYNKLLSIKQPELLYSI